MLAGINRIVAVRHVTRHYSARTATVLQSLVTEHRVEDVVHASDQEIEMRYALSDKADIVNDENN